MKLALIVQRYGLSINGGAELHARYVAEHLSRHANVEVLTTCASDYVTWRNDLPEGIERLNGVPVRRFPVDRERDPLVFGRHSERVFRKPHSVADELDWLDAEGPTSPALISYIAGHARDYDHCIVFSYRYYHAYHGIRAAADRAILVPTAERDPTVGLSIFKPIFRGVRALMYNSPEERAMLQNVAGNEDVPSVVVGVGSEVPAHSQAGRFRQKYGINGPFVLYVGRIDENKGCKELFEHFDAYVREGGGRLSLILIGNSLLPIPANPRIRHLGFLPDEDKFDALAAADLLVMPSYFESLSMVVLEAWALGRPVIVNGRCDVLRGQAVRSNAGLYYESRGEFVETMRAIEQNRWLAASLGRSGRRFYQDNYDWPVIERKYLDMLERLTQLPPRAIEPLPGWIGRRRPDCLAAADVVAALPSGPEPGPESAASEAETDEPPPDAARPASTTVPSAPRQGGRPGGHRRRGRHEPARRRGRNGA